MAERTRVEYLADEAIVALSRRVAEDIVLFGRSLTDIDFLDLATEMPTNASAWEISTALVYATRKLDWPVGYFLLHIEAEVEHNRIMADEDAWRPTLTKDAIRLYFLGSGYQGMDFSADSASWTLSPSGASTESGVRARRYCRGRVPFQDSSIQFLWQASE